MRIAGAISVHRPGPAWARATTARPVHPFAIAGVMAAETLPPPRRGDAAWLTLLAAQTHGDTSSPDRAGVHRAYAAQERDVSPIFILRA